METPVIPWQEGAALMCGCGGLDAGWITPAQPSASFGKCFAGAHVPFQLHKADIPEEEAHCRPGPAF